VDYDQDPTYVFNHETLGFRVDSTAEINYNKDWSIEPDQIKNLKSFIGAIMKFIMEMANNKHLHKNDWNRTIFIDSVDVKTTEFKLNKDKINLLFQNGKIGVSNYFNWKDNDNLYSSFPK
jgi:NTE family protein